jgi:hypothetical protein
LRFVRPIAAAVLVHAVRGLEIAANWIDGVEPFGGAGVGIIIQTSGSIPVLSDSGRPERVSGTLTIKQNNVDVPVGTARESTLGIFVWSVGQSPRTEVALDINSNKIHNTTSSAIMVRRANGLVHVLSNTVETSTEVAPDGYEVVRLVNTGTYRMARNTIDCRWANCVGIAVFSQVGEWPIRGAIVEDNQVNMLPPPGTVFADSSSGIAIKGFADSNTVRYNTIRGRARAALALETFKLGYPRDNAVIENHVDGFQASVASVVVGRGVSGTRLVQPGTFVDRGVKTRIER